MGPGEEELLNPASAPLELSPVEYTAILTLRARVDEQVRTDRLFSDPESVRWLHRLGWPAHLSDWYASGLQNWAAIRAHQLDLLLQELLNRQPSATVVELGCGFSTRRSRCLVPIERWVDVDLPQVMAWRQILAPTAGLRIAASVTDGEWMTHLDPSRPHLFVAEGLVYYLPEDAFRHLLRQMQRRFPRSHLLMDLAGPFGFGVLVDKSRAVGAPMQWSISESLEDTLKSLGLVPPPGMEPGPLLEWAHTHYWHRFDGRTRAALLLSGPFGLEGRGGVVVGQLNPST